MMFKGPAWVIGRENSSVYTKIKIVTSFRVGKASIG